MKVLEKGAPVAAIVAALSTLACCRHNGGRPLLTGGHARCRGSVGCAFVLRLCATLLQEVGVQQTQHRELGSFLDCCRGSGPSDFISPGNCQRGRWLVSSRIEWRKESTFCGLLP